MTRLSFAPVFGLLALFVAIPALGADVSMKVEFARRGAQTLACVMYAIPPDYHAYAHEPGDTGKPTELDFVLEGEGSMPVIYPAGEPEKDIFDPSLTINAYYGNVALLAILPSYSGGKLFAASLKMLLCSNRNCIPVQQDITGAAPEVVPPLSDVPWQNQALALLAKASDSSGASSLEAGGALPPARAEAAPEEIADDKAPAPRQEDAETPIPRGEKFDLGLSPQYMDEGLEIYSLGKALLFGVLAGLLLNVMPCVLPVLTLKVSSLLMLGGDSKKKLRSFRIHNMAFAAGVFTLFTFLAILLGLADLMWGQLYQNEVVLLLMLLLVFLMGLSMLGVFTLPAFDLKIGENTPNPTLKSYLTGLVSTFLATPCSGPLLGGVLAWAFAQPLPILMAVFWSVGAGMSLPYIVFSIWPALARILPRPGAWMLAFERILGFFLLATALYLLYILPESKRMQILCLLLLAGFCAWFWGAFCGLNAPRLRRRLAATAGALLLCASVFWTLQPERPAPEWRAFSPETFAKALGHRDMLVEFTADWCPNCKFLEASVLTDKNLRAWQKKYGLELVKVDLTRSSPYAEALLAQLGSKSIPLTALFGRGGKAKSPLVLRDIYTNQTLEKALAATF